MSNLFNLLLAFVLSILSAEAAHSNETVAQTNTIICEQQLHCKADLNNLGFLEETTRIIKN